MPFHPFSLLVKILFPLFFFSVFLLLFPQLQTSTWRNIPNIPKSINPFSITHTMEDVSTKIQMPALPSSDVFWTTYITILSVEKPVNSFCPFKDQPHVAVISGSLFHLQGADFGALTRQLDI